MTINTKQVGSHSFESVHCRQPSRMGVVGEVRDFLESSTIHGLAHISTGKTAVVKILWAIIVIICFCFGISLIFEAYRSWELSPIITSVDTHPISRYEKWELWTFCYLKYSWLTFFPKEFIVYIPLQGLPPWDHAVPSEGQRHRGQYRPEGRWRLAAHRGTEGRVN